MNLSSNKKNYLKIKKFIYPIILSLIYFTLLVIVSPIPNCPLNDDWAYAQTVSELLQKGQFNVLDYSSPTIIFHVFWGALFCLLFGLSYNSLHLSVIFLSVIGLITFYYIVLKISKNQKLSFYAALVMVINPLYFSLSGTFMTDVPFTTFTLLSLYFFIIAYEKETLSSFIFATLFSIFASLTRQLGIVLPLSFIILFLVKNRVISRPVLYSVISFILVFLSIELYKSYLIIYNHLPSSFISIKNIIHKTYYNDTPYNQVLSRIGYSFFYIGLFSLPISILSINKKIHINFYKLIIYSIVLFFVAKILKNVPVGNIINNFYLGPNSLKDSYLLGVNQPSKIFHVLLDIFKITSILGVIMWLIITVQVLEKYLRNKENNNPEQTIIFNSLFFTFTYIFSLLFAICFFDRYLVIPIFLALLPVLPNKLNNIKKFQYAISFIIFFAVSIYTVCGTHDYFSWNFVRWEAIKYLKNRGVSCYNIDGGYEYNGWFNYSKSSKSDYTDWWAPNDTYTISFGTLPGTKIIREFTYNRWLTLKKEKLYILGKKSQDSIANILSFDSEITSPNGKYLLTKDNRYAIEKVVRRSNEKAHSRNYSIKLDNQNYRAFDINIYEVYKGDYIEALLWYYSNEPNDSLFMVLKYSEPGNIRPKLVKTENSWQLLSYSTYCSMPTYFINIGFINTGNNTLYIDDLSINIEKFHGRKNDVFTNEEMSIINKNIGVIEK